MFSFGGPVDDGYSLNSFLKPTAQKEELKEEVEEEQTETLFEEPRKIKNIKEIKKKEVKPLMLVQSLDNIKNGFLNTEDKYGFLSRNKTMIRALQTEDMKELMTFLKEFSS